MIVDRCTTDYLVPVLCYKMMKESKGLLTQCEPQQYRTGRHLLCKAIVLCPLP